MNPEKTIHTSRTIMFAELAKVMNHGVENDDYSGSLQQDVISKTTKLNGALTGVRFHRGHHGVKYGIMTDICHWKRRRGLKNKKKIILCKTNHSQ